MLVTQLKDEFDLGSDSSDDEICDSDKIDSDVEAELYSVIHHQDSFKNDIEKSDSVSNISNEEDYVTNININNNKHINNLSSIQIDEEFVTDDFFRNNLYINFESPEKVVDQSREKASNRDSLKRKSDLVCNLLENLQSTSKKQKLTSKYALNNNKISEPNNEVVLLSSDDDSDIIWTEPGEIESSIQTNLSKNFIAEDSDSESNDSWCHNFSSTTNTTSINNQDSWYINPEDAYRYRKTFGRYHDRRDLNCSKCNQKGHITKACPVPEVRKCFICGSHHQPSYCKTKICINCHKCGHEARYCPKRPLSCALCEMTGHHAEQCPDLWRKFQLTTTHKFVKSRRLQQNTPLYCYNCGQKGHFGGECFKNRMNTYSFHTWPTVINSALSKQIKHKLKKAQKKTAKKKISKVPMRSFHSSDSVQSKNPPFSNSVSVQQENCNIFGEQVSKEKVTRKRKKKVKKTDEYEVANNIIETNNDGTSQSMQPTEDQVNVVADSVLNLSQSPQNKKRNKKRIQRRRNKKQFNRILLRNHQTDLC